MAKKTGGALFITGIDSLDAKLRKMKFSVQGRILRNAMKEAMQPVLEEARNTIPVDTGYTKKRLRIKPGKPKRNGERTVRVGIFGPATKGRGKDPVPTGRIIEFGTTSQSPQYILRKSLSSKEASVKETLRQRLREMVAAVIL